MSFSVEQLEQILAAIDKNNIQGFHLEDGEFLLDITGNIPPTSTSITTSTQNTVPIEDSCVASLGTVMPSPIVGTFYESPAPDQAPYVTIGSKITKGDTLFIIESMKLMNEVVAEQSGIVREIHVRNQESVEYGQPILTIE